MKWKYFEYGIDFCVEASTNTRGVAEDKSNLESEDEVELDHPSESAKCQQWKVTLELVCTKLIVIMIITIYTKMLTPIQT